MNANRRNIFLPKVPMLLSLASVFATFILLIISSPLEYNDEKHWIFKLNEYFINKSLNLSISLPMVIGSLAPAISAVYFSWKLPLDQQSQVVDILYERPNLCNWKAEFRLKTWGKSPIGVRNNLFLLDILSGKLGASVTGTVLGASLYFSYIGIQSISVTLMSALLNYYVIIFPGFIRFILQKRYEKKPENPKF